MRYSKRFVTGLLLLCCSITSHLSAQTQGIFWQADYKEGTAYLLGSVHFGNANFYPLADHIMQGFADSKVLLVEMDDQKVSPQEQVAIMQSTVLYPPGDGIERHLSAATRKLLKHRLEELGIPLASVQQFRPGFLMITMAAMQAISLGYTPELGVDLHFIQKARGNKPIEQIESFRQQMELLANLPEDDAMIRDNLEQLDENEELWRKMEQAWRQGDDDRLYQLAIAEPLAEYPELQPLYEALFFKRNQNMANAVGQCVKTHGVCFVVVGAGHIVGERGIVDILRKEGVKMSPGH